MNFTDHHHIFYAALGHSMLPKAELLPRKRIVQLLAIHLLFFEYKLKY